MKPWWIYKTAKYVALAAAMFVVLGCAVMLLWNALIPDIFHGPLITFWQAVGLLVLSHILVRGWGGRWHGGWRHHQLRHKMEERLAAMAPEEREKFREERDRRCCSKDPDKEK